MASDKDDGLQLSNTSECHKKIKIWESKIYGVPKRRRFSAIRDFPSGCGSHAANVNKLECTEAIASHVDKFSPNEKRASIEDKNPSENMQVKDITNAKAAVHPQSSSFDLLKTDMNMSASREFPLNSGNIVLKCISSLADKMLVDELKPVLQTEPLIHSHPSSPDSLKSDRNVCAFQDITLGHGSDPLNVNTEDPTQKVSSLADKMSCDDLKLVVGKEPFLENTNMDIELLPEQVFIWEEICWFVHKE